MHLTSESGDRIQLLTIRNTILLIARPLHPVAQLYDLCQKFIKLDALTFTASREFVVNGRSQEPRGIYRSLLGMIEL